MLPVGVAHHDEEERLASEPAAVEHLAHVRRRQDLLAPQVVCDASSDD